MPSEEIQREQDEASRMKELKVRIPISYHVHLHSMKVLTGKPISDAVTEALERYFGKEPTFDASVYDLGNHGGNDTQ